MASAEVSTSAAALKFANLFAKDREEEKRKWAQLRGEKNLDVDKSENEEPHKINKKGKGGENEGDTKVDEESAKKLGGTDYSRFEQLEKDLEREEKLEAEQKKVLEDHTRAMMGCSHDHTKERQIYEKPTKEKIEAADRFRLEGNAAFKDKNFGLAAVNYRKALLQFDYTFPDTEKDNEWMNSVKLPCHLNLAACKIQQQDWQEVLIQCRLALEIDRTNVKALYRRGITYLALDDFDKADEALNSALRVEPHNPAVRSAVNELRQKRIRYKKRTKLTYQRMLAGDRSGGEESDVFDSPRNADVKGQGGGAGRGEEEEEVLHSHRSSRCPSSRCPSRCTSPCPSDVPSPPPATPRSRLSEACPRIEELPPDPTPPADPNPPVVIRESEDILVDKSQTPDVPTPDPTRVSPTPLPSGSSDQLAVEQPTRRRRRHSGRQVERSSMSQEASSDAEARARRRVSQTLESSLSSGTPRGILATPRSHGSERKGTLFLALLLMLGFIANLIVGIGIGFWLGSSPSTRVSSPPSVVPQPELPSRNVSQNTQKMLDEIIWRNSSSKSYLTALIAPFLGFIGVGVYFCCMISSGHFGGIASDIPNLLKCIEEEDVKAKKKNKEQDMPRKKSREGEKKTRRRLQKD